MSERVLIRTQLIRVWLKLLDADVLIIVTNENPGNAIKTYGLRWEVELIFSCLKERGFNFEDTHITDQERIKKLLSRHTFFIAAH
jgi:hypothetical protein